MVKRKSNEILKESNFPPDNESDEINSAIEEIEINNDADSSDEEVGADESDFDEETETSDFNDENDFNNDGSDLSDDDDDDDEDENEDEDDDDDENENEDENENSSDYADGLNGNDEEHISESNEDQSTSRSDEENKTSNLKAQTEKNAKTEPKKRNSAKINKNTKNKSQNVSDQTISDEKQLDSTLNKLKEASEAPRATVDEYEEDTSDEEDIRNTIGNIPLEWYKDYTHLGYDWDGEKIRKPKQGDKLDDFLKRVEDPDFWRTVFEPYTNQNVVLSDEDVELIKRIQAQRIPDAQFDEYAPWIEWFTSQVEKMPIVRVPEHKRSFTPSRSEAKKVSKLVHALKMGWIKTRKELAELRAKKDPQFYMLWSADDEPEHMRRIHKHIPAPKRHLPGHAESYNPPPEYLFDEKEMKQWNKLQRTPWKRKLHFIPQKYSSLREVPAYARYIRERFQRCLDLYLCPRAIKMKLQIEAEDLVPKLPSPRDLQPFPTTESLVYKGHTDMVRSITIETKGQYLASGSDDQTVKVWEIATGRCVKTFKMNDIVRCVAWCPNPALSLLLVAEGKRVNIINPGVGDKLIVSKTDSVLEQVPVSDIIENERIKTAVRWENFTPTSDEWSRGIRATLHHFKEVTQVTWHGRGDYIASVMPEGQNRSVLISQLSKRRSQLPFSKSKGLIQCVLFHPIKPFLFVATQRNVRIYDLVKQELIKKLLSNSKWISTMAIHPGGDNVLVGTYDRKMLWFDLDLSTKPYQTLRLHGTAVRGVAFHKRYPLFASGSDDRSLIICHGMVYNDLLKNPLIVPLKRIQNHEAKNDFGIFSVIFHPNQPWVFTSGADATIRLYT